jgi:hypothetical protein
VSGLFEASEHQVGEVTVFGAVRRMKLIVADEEALIGRAVLLGDAGDQRLGRQPLGLRLDHDRRAVRVFSTHVETVVTLHPLKSNPNIGLNGLDDVTEVQRAVGVGQGAGDEDLP